MGTQLTAAGTLARLMVCAAVLGACGSDLSEVECTSNQQCAASLVCVAGDCIRPDEVDGESDTDEPTDTELDAPSDAGPDVPVDAPLDAPDVAPDIGVDTDPDVAVDTTPDVTPDSAVDAAVDTVEDTDGGLDADRDVRPDLGLDTARDVAEDAEVDAGPRCGNGVIDEGETCDPAIERPPGLPPCSPMCTYCGDGNVDAGEVCDPNAVGGALCARDCSADWTDEACAPCGDSCLGDAVCTPRSSLSPICLPTCSSPASRDCPADFTCETAFGVCVPADGTCPDVCSPERCGNGIDDDCDGAIDCGDSDCGAAPACSSSPEVCSDGIDNDRDGDVDCDDSDCDGALVCDPTCPDEVIGEAEGPGVFLWEGRFGDLAPRPSTCEEDASGFSLVWRAPATETWWIDASVSGGFGFPDLFGPVVSVEYDTCGGPPAGCGSVAGSSVLSFDAAEGEQFVIHVTTLPPPLPIADGITMTVSIGRAETGGLCSDGIDNDLDGALDCDDSDCATASACVPDGACGLEPDQGIIASGALNEAAADCGFGCLGDADPTACVEICVAENTGLTRPCAYCYAASFTCLVSNCLSPCASDPGGASCTTCQEENCLPAFYDCTGPIPE